MENINDPNRITFIGNVDYRNKMIKFGIKAKDRTKHTYIIGKSGMGKSTVMENMAIQDIQNGEGLAFLDPHGGTAEKLLDFVPEHRKKDVIYFAPFDTENPIGLNVLERVDISKRHLVANGLMAAFKKVFGEDKFSDRMQYILNNIILTLLENDDETLIGINRILSDKEYRKKMVANVKDPSIKSFWVDEYAKAGEKYQQEAAPAIQNKIGQFTSNPLIRNIVGQKRTSFDIRDIMDNKKILIMNLSKGKMGEGNANLIGSLLITKIYLAAMSRADVDPYKLDQLPPFYFYVDEFQNFANESFANILSEARKYQLALTVAHQYVDQMTDEVKAAIFGNVGTMITFRVGATDAEIFEKEFAPVFTADAIVNLSAFQMYLRLMIDSVGSKPFSARGLPPIDKPSISFTDEIIKYSRETYAKKAEDVESDIQDWFTIHNDAKIDEPVVKKDYRPKYDNNNNHNNNYKTNNSNNNSNNNYSHLKSFAEEINKEPISVNGEKKEFNNNPNRDLNRDTNKDFSRPHTRSRFGGKKENDTRDVDMSRVREEGEAKKEEVKENRFALKDAIEKAMGSQKMRVEKIVHENKEEENISTSSTGSDTSVFNEEKREEIKKENREIKEELKNISEEVKVIEDKIKIEEKEIKNLQKGESERKEAENNDEIKEIPEKILRDLVDGE